MSSDLAGEKIQSKTIVSDTSIVNASATSSDNLPVIDVSGVGKVYRIYAKPHHRLLQSIFRNRAYYREFWSLRDINITVGKGETIGILGQNGSGKSTLLQIVAGTLAPSEGNVSVRGRVAALLELGSGFNPEFTGRENVFLNGSIVGIGPDQMAEKFDDIAAFAEIGDFIDQPVKTYSSGMVVRLAFSVAINVEPNILIVDEALSVGDARFQQRCMTRIRQMRDSGISILFVTHDTEACKRLCQRVYVLDKGKLINSGPADAMANWYLGFLTKIDGTNVRMSSEGTQTNAVLNAPAESNVPEKKEFAWFRHGDGGGEIESCEILGPDGKAVDHVVMDESYTFIFKLLFKAAVAVPIFGFYLKDRLGTDIYGINTLQENQPLPSARSGSRVCVSVKIPLSIKPGYYSISPALAYSQDEMKYMDYIHHALVFRVIDSHPTRHVFGILHPKVEISIHVEQ